MNSMKAFAKKNLFIYKYPQFLFSQEIIKALKSCTEKKKVMIDVPCGNGQTSFLLARAYKQTKVYGYDLSSIDINFACSNFKLSNLFFETEDIKNMLNKHSEVDVICIINSIFLLPDNNYLFKQIDNTLNKMDGKLCFIIPNLKGKNYKNFMKYYDGSININEYSPKELISILSEYNFEHQLTKPLAYTYFYGRKDLKYFRFMSSFYLHFLNFIQTTFSFGTPSYFLLIFGRKDELKLKVD